MMDKRFVIFDIDGTLVDSMGYWRRLDKEFLAHYDIPEIPKHILEKTAATTMKESAKVFIEDLGIPGTVESIAKEFYDLMEMHYAKDIEAKPGVLAYLEKLKRNGVRMAAASATPLRLLEIVTERLGISSYLEFILSCEEVGVGKSKPTVFMKAAERLGGKPADTAVFEDSFVALTTAKNAGFYTIAIRDEDNDAFWSAMKTQSDEAIEDWRDYE